MKRVKVFAPGTVANIGCGFDVMGLTLDGVGDVVAVTLYDDKDEFDRHASASGNAFVSTACIVSVKNNSSEGKASGNSGKECGYTCRFRNG